MKNWPAPRVLLFNDRVVEFNEEDLLNRGGSQAFVYPALKSTAARPRDL